jgi:hypothetical protein
MRVLSKQWTQRNIARNTDEVLAWLPLPDSARVNNLWLESHVISARELEYHGLVYGMSGQIVRKIDPDDASRTYDQEWDLAVSKDRDMSSAAAGLTALHSSLDLDISVAEVITPESAPGLMDVEGLFGKDLQGNQEFFNRTKMLTTVNAGRNFNSGDNTVTMTDLVHSRIKFGNKYKVDGLHTAMVGFSNPYITNTINTMPYTPTEHEWLILSYIDGFIDEMQAYAIGMVPSTSEDPYQEVSVFIADLLSGEPLEDTGGFWADTNFTVFTKATWDVTLADRRAVSVLSA